MEEKVEISNELYALTIQFYCLGKSSLEKDDIRLDSDEDFSTATDNSPSQDLTGMIKLQNLVSFLQASALYSLCDFTAVDGWEGK